MEQSFGILGVRFAQVFRSCYELQLGFDKSSFSSQQFDDGKFLSHRRWLKRRISMRPICILAFQIDLYLQSFVFPVEIEIQEKTEIIIVAFLFL